jgi:hypothetical protein
MARKKTLETLLAEQTKYEERLREVKEAQAKLRAEDKKRERAQAQTRQMRLGALVEQSAAGAVPPERFEAFLAQHVGELRQLAAPPAPLSDGGQTDGN